MYNNMCSPELSYGSMENEPHAYVHYEVDDNKEIVPLSFLFKFPAKWREEGWDKNYLFKVFWSPYDEDTPRKMLKRVPSIPVYEKGCTQDKAGYYRAAVLEVKGEDNFNTSPHL